MENSGSGSASYTQAMKKGNEESNAAARTVCPNLSGRFPRYWERPLGEICYQSLPEWNRPKLFADLER
jgi:hypothetical protein